MRTLLILGKCSSLSPAGNEGARNLQYPQEQQLHTGILSPLRSSCVSLDALGEEHWSFLHGYTEVSEVSAAVCRGEDAGTRRQHHRHRVFLECWSLHVIRERGRHWLHLGIQHCHLYCYRDMFPLAAHPAWVFKYSCLKKTVPFVELQGCGDCSSPALKRNET